MSMKMATIQMSKKVQWKMKTTSTQTLCAIHSQYSQLQSAKVTYKVAISFTKVQLTTVIYSKTKLAIE